VPGGLHADQFRVELYAAQTTTGGRTPEVIPACDSSVGPSGTLLYSVCCPATRPADDYTARVVPSHAGALVLSKPRRFSGNDEIRRSHPRASDVPVSCPYPLGASVTPEGTNFSIFSASAEGMQLVLFDHPDAPRPAQTITLDPVRNRTSHYWHTFLPGIKCGQLYGYRADGPCDPAAGQRFDRENFLLDPTVKVSRSARTTAAARHASRATMPRLR